MADGFTGWCRVGRAPWRRITDAATEAECWQRLPGLSPAVACRDLCVLPAGADPNQRRKSANDRNGSGNGSRKDNQQ